MYRSHSVICSILLGRRPSGTNGTASRVARTGNNVTSKKERGAKLALTVMFMRRHRVNNGPRFLRVLLLSFAQKLRIMYSDTHGERYGP